MGVNSVGSHFKRYVLSASIRIKLMIARCWRLNEYQRGPFLLLIFIGIQISLQQVYELHGTRHSTFR